ncbi:hypothetical protein GC089_18195 [Cellulomonas sp. JZ18]|uniref:putative T7SS-secreted protein n=1 Tax=Cellulomonas sp. JZ18 TaxID=2654191 RepID=UPI0012D424A9|nr:hypothetical protein [Cellulomonas sp. JZ18]QGQ20769.1 hypothetical protein GC089_18195 [Cellulomonas sp. JZ18]
MTAPASAELGESDDPVALVPGQAGDVREVAATLRSWSTRLSDTGDHLRTLRAPSWTGEGADAFWASFGPVPAVWFTASDLLADAATALEAHADAITRAQDKAQDAIDRWNRGEERSAAARAAYQQAAQRFAQQGGVHPVFVDTGEADRREAREILEDARSALDESGHTAIMALVEVGGGTLTQGGSQGPGAEGSWSWGSAKSDQWKQQWGGSWAGDPGGPAELGLSAVLASVHGAAWVWRTQGSFTRPLGGGAQVYGNGSVSVLSAEATGSASWSNGKGFHAQANAEANLAKAEGQVGYRNDWADAHVSGTAQAGAYAKGEAQFTTDGVELSGEALAGAKVAVEGEASLGGIGITAGAEGWAGAGAGGSVQFGMEDGKWRMGVSGGVAWGSAVSCRSGS